MNFYLSFKSSIAEALMGGTQYIERKFKFPKSKSNIGFREERKTGVRREKNLSEQSREPTNSSHMRRQVWETKSGHIGGRREIALLCNALSPPTETMSTLMAFRLKTH